MFVKIDCGRVCLGCVTGLLDLLVHRELCTSGHFLQYNRLIQARPGICKGKKGSDTMVIHHFKGCLLGSQPFIWNEKKKKKKKLVAFELVGISKVNF